MHWIASAAWSASGKLRLIFIVEGTLSSEEFEAQVGRNCSAMLPALCQRPSDLAAYARRCARLASDRIGKTGRVVFSDEAAFAILTYAWPGNYKEVQQAVTSAVDGDPSESVSFDALLKALKFNSICHRPGRRVEALMKLAQGLTSIWIKGSV